ncbi:MAG TPA: ATP-binding protein [Ramlibacter sp.]|nr:ATP-binding protein [Ramlibacter sp.]
MRRWARAILAIGLACLAGVAPAAVQEPSHAAMLTAPDAAPPARAQSWQEVPLPDIWRQARPGVRPATTWYRIDFDYAPGRQPGEPWALYLPYLSDGGQVWVNGAPAGSVRESSETIHIRWARPHLVTLPASLLRPGSNELAVRVALPQDGAAVGFPRPDIGPLAQLQPIYERRFFWVNTTPQITAAVCLLVSGFVLFIWWRRRIEVLYGLFGLAAGLWGIRTLTFVIETVPLERWLLWRLTYLGATGGFIVAMAVLALRFAGIRRPWVERALAFYWLLGPVWLLAGGAAVEPLVNRYWIAGFLPVGLAIVVISLWTMWRQHTLVAAVLPAAMVIAVLTGLHDYLVNWSFGGAAQLLLPGWAGHRIFLLHHGANLILVAMGGLLTARFIGSLAALEGMNQMLETRVADRERELSANYARLAQLQREHAAAQERQLIMRDIHDGLGSQLFVSLSRVERGDMQGQQVADALRGCIADMRLALGTLTPEDSDFRATLGDFLFRWETQLRTAGIHPAWTIDVPEGALEVKPHAALQLLRVAQEALTNVLKHAHASRVQVRLRQVGDLLELQVEDDGHGGAAAPTDSGRGMNNMRARAQQLGGRLDVRNGAEGTCVSLQVPVNAVLA